MSKAKVGAIVAGVVIFGGLIVGSMFVTKVPVGHVGVVYNMSGVKDTPLSQGWHGVAPMDKVIEYPIKMKTITYDSVEVATSDGKNIDVDISYSFSVDSTKAVSLYNKFGAVSVDDIADGHLRTRLRDSARQVVSKYSVIDIYGEKSSEAQALIQTKFGEDVGQLGFIIEGLTLGVPKPDETTQASIDARVKASQILEAKKTEIETAIKEKERLRIEAEGIEEYNKIISQSITPALLQQQMLEKWNGVLPTVTGSDDFMIQLPTKSTTAGQ